MIRSIINLFFSRQKRSSQRTRRPSWAASCAVHNFFTFSQNARQRRYILSASTLFAVNLKSVDAVVSFNIILSRLQQRQVHSLRWTCFFHECIKSTPTTKSNGLENVPQFQFGDALFKFRLACGIFGQQTCQSHIQIFNRTLQFVHAIGKRVLHDCSLCKWDNRMGSGVNRFKNDVRSKQPEHILANSSSSKSPSFRNNWHPRSVSEARASG